MCGLVGVLGPLTKQYQLWFADALVVDSIRGHDSTGIFVVDKNNSVSVEKEAVSGSSFVRYNKRVDKLLVDDAVVTIGHNRWATRGSISKENAHPFSVGDITLVHNGTMTYVPQMHKFSVDSEALASAINASGREGLEESSGAYSIVAYNSRNKILTLARNKERPMCWASTKDGNILLASEMGLIEWLAARHGIELTAKNQTKESIWYDINPWKLSSTIGEHPIVEKPVYYTKPATKAWSGRGEVDYVVATEIHLKQLGVLACESVRWCKWAPGKRPSEYGTLIGHILAEPYYEVQVRFCKFQEIDKHIGATTSIPIKAIVGYNSDDPMLIAYQADLFKEGVPRTVVVPFVPAVTKGASVYKGPLGENLSLKAWRKVVAGGCSLCSTQFSRKDAKTMAYLKEDNSPLCGECATVWENEVNYAHQAL